MNLRSRRKPPGAQIPHSDPAAITAAIRDGRMRDYADGVADGMKITLRLALGGKEANAEPFLGPLTPEFERWARDALARIEEARA